MSVSLFMGQLSVLATAAISRSLPSFSNAHSSSKNLLDYLFTYLFIYLFASQLAVLPTSFIYTWGRIAVNIKLEGMQWEFPCGKAVPETLSFLT
jgi:hypothetical protein